MELNRSDEPCGPSVLLADVSYLVLAFGPTVGMLSAIRSVMTLIDQSGGGLGQTAFFLIGTAIMWLSLLVGGVLAIAYRRHRPLLFLGMFALVLCVIVFFSNMFGFGRGWGTGSVIFVILLGTSMVICLLCAVVVMVAWFVRWRKTHIRNMIDIPPAGCSTRCRLDPPVDGHR
jgi:hypothetical protein